ncbi:hypothetical protein [Candidatus Methanoperedens nitratireducens]|uniref:Uncharacterized protein n=1 Tax=Candidatus Methanoperedens nitratireducens TaxID=1392998 RepID=A0A284VP22_9EURY|nr:hypothetical protein [Candidatus Methanoperedens nitroreducens]SNQ61024.1 hypothetical protein MNV_220018 [Candidatus Methanoperedens nitroreducens]
MIKNSKKRNNTEFAILASASPSLSPKHPVVVNLQLDYWIDAVNEYKKIKENNNPNLSYMIKTVNLLGSSLSNLFGANYHTINKRKETPSLKILVEKAGLKTDSRDLYERFLRFNQFYNDVAKHFSSIKIDKAKDLDMNNLKEYMEITRDVWIWYFSKFYYNIPDEQLSHFKIAF